MKDLLGPQRPDLVLEHLDNNKITIIIIDMAFPNEKNIDETENRKLQKY